MNILILTPQLPYPPHQGTSLRNFYIMRGLAETNQIYLLSFLESNQSVVPEAIAPLQALCAELMTVPVPGRTLGQRLWQMVSTRRPDMAHRLASSAFATALQQILGQRPFDIVHIEGIELASYIPIIRQLQPQSCILFDDRNAETELQRRAMWTDFGQLRRWPATLYSAVQVPRLARLEAWACRTADGVTAVSHPDAQLLAQLVPEVPVTVIPNAIDTTIYQEPVAGDLPVFDLVFSGKMDYRPNIDAMLWFADEIWPGILAQRPQTTWAIVGQKPHARLDRLRQLPGVTVTGWVEEVRPYLAGANLYLMPFRLGSGTRLKLIEAMAAGKAIVSTPVGAEGFPVTHDQELWLAADAAAWVTAVVQLLEAPPVRQRLGQAAQQFAQQYDWRVVVPRFEAVYERMIANRSRT